MTYDAWSEGIILKTSDHQHAARMYYADTLETKQRKKEHKSGHAVYRA
jgi:hypothetical protein